MDGDGGDAAQAAAAIAAARTVAGMVNWRITNVGSTGVLAQLRAILSGTFPKAVRAA
jgi:hypothetical protein